MKNKFKSIFYIFFPLLIGVIVSLLINRNFDDNTLAKPFLAPPKILFPIVWSIIYLLMGISFYLVKNKCKDKRVDSIYYLQLIVNALWSIIFFNFKLRFIACLWIIYLVYLVYLMIKSFHKCYKIAARLNYLYFTWLLFATYLCIAIFLLN